MDGLAMALWALWSSNSYSSAVRAGVNLLGDADTASWQPSLEPCELNPALKLSGSMRQPPTEVFDKPSQHK